MTIAGVLHFVIPDKYMQIMPPYLPWHLELVYLSGALEVIFGIGLFFPQTRKWSAWGCIGLFVAVFPANVYLYNHQEILPAPAILHFLRLPFQAVFILWAYWYTRPEQMTEVVDEST